jgi:hypothetical protein
VPIVNDFEKKGSDAISLFVITDFHLSLLYTQKNSKIGI